jgi:hypothetical protein
MDTDNLVYIAASNQADAGFPPQPAPRGVEVSELRHTFTIFSHQWIRATVRIAADPDTA